MVCYLLFVGNDKRSILVLYVPRTSYSGSSSIEQEEIHLRKAVKSSENPFEVRTITQFYGHSVCVPFKVGQYVLLMIL